MNTWSKTENGKSRIAAFKQDIGNAKQRAIQILPSVSGAYAYDPVADRVIGRKGSDGYMDAVRQNDNS